MPDMADMEPFFFVGVVRFLSQLRLVGIYLKVRENWFQMSAHVLDPISGDIDSTPAFSS